MSPKREYGTGGITWLSSTKVRLRVRTDEGRRTKVVKVVPKDHGGRGEAADELASFVAEINAGKAKLGPKTTLGQLLTEYVELCRTNKARAAGTITSYEDSIKRLPESVKAIRVADLTTRDLDIAYGQMKAKYADNTVLLAHSIVRAALTQAITWKYVGSNVAVGASMAETQKPKTKPMPVDDVRKLVVAALTPHKGQEDGDLVVAMAIILATLLGARRGELAGLRWDDLEAQVVGGQVVGCLVKIERQWVPGRTGQYLTHPKRAVDGRVIMIAMDGVRQIEQYRDLQREMLGREPEGWLLSYDAGVTPVSARALGEAIRVLAKNEGLKVSTHRFRKVQATELAASGVDPDTSARRMGHTVKVMFGNYVLGADDRAVAAAGIVEARLIDRGLPLGAMLELPKETT